MPDGGVQILNVEEMTGEERDCAHYVILLYQTHEEAATCEILRVDNAETATECLQIWNSWSPSETVTELIHTVQPDSQTWNDLHADIREISKLKL